MRSVARVKLGYYPLPPTEGERLRKLLQYSDEGASVLDPCVGTGAAIRQITEAASVSLYGVELDAGRAQTAKSNGIEAIHGNVFDSYATVESFSLLYLNPPYDSEIGSRDNKRMELLFLQHTYRWLVPGGVLLMVIPHKQLPTCTGLLSAHFADFRVLRLTDPESERFDQIVLFAVRRRVHDSALESNRQQLTTAIWAKPLPVLTGEEEPYLVPPSPPARMAYRGLPLDLIEDLLLGSSAWKRIAPFVLPKEEASVGRPITPLHGGHVGLLCTAGLMNGVFGQDWDRHIARWGTRKYVSETRTHEEGYTEIRKQERFANELALVYQDGRTLVLTDGRKREDDGERSSEVRAA